MLKYGYLGEVLYSYMNDMNGAKMGHNGKVDEAVQDRMYQVGDWLYTPGYILLGMAETASGASEGPPGAPHDPATFEGANGAQAVK